MRLLVSVKDAEEGALALAGGADVIDAKDPLVGALGPVTLERFREIRARVGGDRPVSAALGDAVNEAEMEWLANSFAVAGAAFVKIGFGGISSPARVSSLTAAAVSGAQGGGVDNTGVVAVAYVDAGREGGLPPQVIAGAARLGGAVGVLLDTSDKRGPGLCELFTLELLTSLVVESHQQGLFIALAGNLRKTDLPSLAKTGADIVGVRGAACIGGRAGTISAGMICELTDQLRLHAFAQSRSAAVRASV
jgi:uncharacterized protein (UPF0264 family)